MFVALPLCNLIVVYAWVTGPCFENAWEYGVGIGVTRVIIRPASTHISNVGKKSANENSSFLGNSMALIGTNIHLRNVRIM